MAAGGCSPSLVFVVLRLLLEVCCFQWQHVGVPCIFLKISKAQQCLWGKNWEGYWCWVCGLAVTDTCSPLLGGRAVTRLPLCMVALVTMALVKWRCTGKSPQCEDSVSKGAQQRQMKHLLSPQPWKGPSGSPALCGFLRNQDLSLGYFTPQVLHLGSVFTARVRRSFAATAFRLARGGGGGACERCCPQCARCWVRAVQRCRWWGSTSFHRAQSAAVLEWLSATCSNFSWHVVMPHSWWCFQCLSRIHFVRCCIYNLTRLCTYPTQWVEQKWYCNIMYRYQI